MIWLMFGQSGEKHQTSQQSSPLLLSISTHLLNELLEKVGLLTERIGWQSIHECHHSVREVVLSEPRHNPALLHVRSSSDIYDEITQLLPVSGNIPTTKSSAPLKIIFKTFVRPSINCRENMKGLWPKHTGILCHTNNMVNNMQQAAQTCTETIF